MDEKTVRLARRRAKKCDVDLLLAQSLDRAGTQQFLHGERHAGKGLAKRPNAVGHQRVEERRGRHSDNEATFLTARGASRRFERFFITCQRYARVREKHAAGRGQLDPARSAVKELHADLGLHGSNALTERRLLRPKPLGCSRDVPFFRDSYEMPEVSHLDCHIELNMNLDGLI